MGYGSSFRDTRHPLNGKVDRRTASLIILAALAGGSSVALRASDAAAARAKTIDAPRTAKGGAGVVRVTNQGASIMEQGISGGSGMVRMLRRPMRLPFAFKRSRVFIPMFTVVTANRFHADTFFSDARSFQRGINPTFRPGLKGTPARSLYTFDGATTFHYDPATWDPSQPGIMSDWLDHAEIPADTDFEWSNAIRTAEGQLPYTMNLFGDIQTTTGFTGADTDIMGTDGLAAQADWKAFASGKGGVAYDNAILVVEAPAGTPGVVTIGDSNVYSIGYDRGDAYGVAGAMTRGFVNRRKVPHLNLGRGSDGDYSLGTLASRGALRRRMLEVLHAAAGFTLRVHAMGGNDVTKNFTIASWAASTSYALYDHVAINGAGQYICTKAGTSGRTTPAGTGRGIVDGTAEWAGIDGLRNGGADQQYGELIANEARSNDWLRQALPGVPAYGVTIVPQTTSTDQWLTSDHQTAVSGWGDAATKRGVINAQKRSLLDLYGYAGCLDPNLYVEEDYPGTETSKWRSDGVTAKLYTVDGTHFNAYGATAASEAVDVIA